MATGCISTAQIPKIPGLEHFNGEVYHTGNWPHKEIDFSSKRIAVVGVGSSGIQSIPVLAEQARHLTVFQRTPNFSIPSQNEPMTADYEKLWKSDYASRREEMRYTPHGSLKDLHDKSALSANEEERQLTYQKRWEIGGAGYLGAFNDLLTNIENSCLIKFGNTIVICKATIEESVPPFLRKSGLGWVTAEYGMLPSSTNERIRREANQTGHSGRTQVIQRLIGRSLRLAVDRVELGERQIIVDCDVIQADGGTRTASITGGCVALFLAIKNHHDDQRAIEQYVAAISLGVKDDEILVDLDYQEDSTADADINIVMTHNLDLIEIQGTAEERPFSQEQLTEIVNKASTSIKDIINIQKQAVEG